MEKAPLGRQIPRIMDFRRNLGGLMTMGHKSGTPPTVIMSPTMCTTTPVSMDSGNQPH
ncbi:hypothetical protein D3C71_2121110 [compost metagenome]